MKKPAFKPAYFVIIGVLLGLGGFFLLLANPFGWPSLSPSLTSTISSPQDAKNAPPQKGLVAAPTPILILPTGKQTYNVQGGETDISQILSVTVDPLDIKKGQTQFMSVKMNSKEPISDFTATLFTDNSKQVITFKLASGDEKTGVWEADYIVNDSTDKAYGYVYNIVTKNGDNTRTTFPVR